MFIREEHDEAPKPQYPKKISKKHRALFHAANGITFGSVVIFIILML